MEDTEVTTVSDLTWAIVTQIIVAAGISVLAIMTLSRTEIPNR